MTLSNDNQQYTQKNYIKFTTGGRQRRKPERGPDQDSTNHGGPEFRPYRYTGNSQNSGLGGGGAKGNRDQ